MAHKAVIKQNKVVDDNNVNQAFLADNTQDYYDGQALTIDKGVVAPVTAADEVVFGIATCTRHSDTLETNFQVNLRQPRTGDTFLLETDFDLADSLVGTYYGIIPEEDENNNPTGGYVISADGESKQWRLIKVFSKTYGEFEFERYVEPAVEEAVEEGD